MKLTISGHVPSKKNSKRLVYAGHRPVIISSKAYEAWHTVALLELQHQVKGMRNRIKMSVPHHIEITIFAESARKNDLTNKAESLMDLLVDYGLIEDDNWFLIPEIVLKYGGINRANPRAEIDILPIKVENTKPKKS